MRKNRADDFGTIRKTRSLTEVAKILGISRSSAYEAAKCGDIKTIRVGKRILVPVVALEKMLGAS